MLRLHLLLLGLTAGAALLTDYILTVSVSTAAGVAAIPSAAGWGIALDEISLGGGAGAGRHGTS